MPLKYLAITCLLLTLALPSTANATGKPAPDHNHSSSQQLLQMKLNGGKKWQTDTALRQGMAAIHLELVEFMPAFHQGSLSSDELQRLASGIEAQVASIVANCKLDAQADAQLHIVIAQLLEGVEQLAGKQPDVNPTQGVITILSGMALLHKSAAGRTTPIPKRIYPIRTVCGVPSAVKRFRIAAQI